MKCNCRLVRTVRTGVWKLELSITSSLDQSEAGAGKRHILDKRLVPCKLFPFSGHFQSITIINYPLLHPLQGKSSWPSKKCSPLKAWAYDCPLCDVLKMLPLVVQLWLTWPRTAFQENCLSLSLVSVLGFSCSADKTLQCHPGEGIRVISANRTLHSITRPIRCGRSWD